MERWIRGTLLIVGLMACSAELAEGAQKAQPRRYYRGSYNEHVIIRHRNGQTSVRQVYPGYSSNFPTPAVLYFGYPHAGGSSAADFTQPTP